MTNQKNFSPHTLAIQIGRPAASPDAPLNVPITLSATMHAGGPVGYGRYGNESWTALEAVIGSLEDGPTLVFSSGIAAINTVFSLLPEGSVITASNQGYSGTMALLKNLQDSGRVDVRYVNVSNTAEVVAALPGTSLLWLESPTNPGLEVADLPVLIAEAKAHGCGVAVDNTFATPMNQRPLMLGADIVCHSVTKYLSGHSDVLLGSISTRDEALYGRLENARKVNGAIAGPFEAWLALRGIRTYPLRFERAQKNALEIARRLKDHELVSEVHYPGLESDPFHARAKSFMNGFGAILSFTLDMTPEETDRVCASSKVVIYATSLGGVESLWERRRRWSGESRSVPESLVRLSVGCEDLEDLWADIEESIATGKKA